MNKLDKFFKKLAIDLEESIFDLSIDTDHPKCPECGSKMSFYGHDSNGVDYAQGDAYWECPNCGFSFDENRVREYDPKDL